MEWYLIISGFVGIILYNLVRSSYNSNKPDNRCTFFFDGNWKGCCWAHDAGCLLALEYLSPFMRLEEDIKLFKCVYEKNIPIAFIMYFGVRLWAYTFWWIGYLREWNEQRQEKAK